MKELTNSKLEDADRLLTKREAAYFLNVHVRTLENWMKDRLITYVSFEGGAIRFTREDIERRIEECKLLSKSEVKLRRSGPRAA
jgi:excisionase family DNA binding protein